ncbi:MAG: PPC domain-containing DNA-binding protein [Halanaerobiales bacterium]
MSDKNKDRTFLIGLSKGEDLIKEITNEVQKRNIEKGIIQAIGAVSQAKIGYYDQKNKEYLYTEFKQHLEIVNCMGNISILEGEPMVHAHIALADKSGKTYGGHLAEGTKIFAAELFIQEISGQKLIRRYEKDRGLTLW